MTVSSIPFWRVVPGDRQGSYLLPVMPAATVGPQGAGHIMGGVALGALVDAMELDCELPVQFATVQFLSPTQHAEELSVQCEQCGGGQAIAQYAAQASVNGRPTHRASAALGQRPHGEEIQFITMPDVTPPDDCPVVERDWAAPGGLIDQIEMRLAWEDNDRGTQALWSRSKAGFAPDAGWLAIISDFFLGAHPASHGIGSSSLDATIRIAATAEPGWVLSVTEFAAFSRGVVHGSARHFSEDGRLLAISSQTGTLPRIPMHEMGQ